VKIYAQTCTTTKHTNKLANVFQTACRELIHVDNDTKRKSPDPFPTPTPRDLYSASLGLLTRATQNHKQQSKSKRSLDEGAGRSLYVRCVILASF